MHDHDRIEGECQIVVKKTYRENMVSNERSSATLNGEILKDLEGRCSSLD